MIDKSIIWTSETEYIDTETGEITRSKKIDHIIIKTEKNANINEINTRGYVKYRVYTRRNPQQELFTD